MEKIYANYLLALCLFNFNYLPAQITYLVKDLSDITQPSEPKKFINSGPYIYFSADDGKNGRELWRTNGTGTGTIMVMDICPGECYGLENTFTENFYSGVNGQFFFVAKDSNAYNQEQLWKTDGTIAGTIILTDFAFGVDIKEEMANVNGTLFFSPEHRQLWKSDGTPIGTVMVKDQIATAGVSPKKYLTNVNGTLFFVGYDATNGYELWKSDGTDAGTVLVKNINSGIANAFMDGYNSFNPYFTNINGELFFGVNDGVNGVELWKSDGTASGTVMIKDINPTGNSIPGDFIELNGEVFFRANNGANGYELWKTDGTAAGTTMVVDLIPDSLLSSYPVNFKILNNMLYFTTGNYQLWKTDGTAAGTELLLSGISSYYTGIGDIEVVGNNIYISFVDTTGNAALWMGDGTQGSFQMLKDINTIVNADKIYNLTAFNGNLIFSANDSILLNEIWISNGTESGTQMIKDINNVGDSYIDHLADVNGTLFFSGTDNSHGRELWKSNGHITGTSMVTDANPNGNSTPRNLVNYKYTLFYNGMGDLWKSDGTAAGTMLVTDSVTNISEIKVMDNFLFLKDGYGLLRSDGTANGTKRILNIYPSEYVKVGNNLFSSAGSSGIWKSDLLNDTSFILKSFSSCNNLINFNDTLYFMGFEQGYDTLWFDSVNYYLMPTYNSALWQSDGTVSGTISINSDIKIDASININGKLFISGNKNSVYGLYQTTSPKDSVSLVKEIVPGSSSYCSNLIDVNGTLFFTVNDGINGMELWKSDGTDSGTMMVKDINPTGSSNPSGLVTKYGILYFSADDGVNGIELWKSDGTETGTVMLADINSSGSSNPEKITISGDYIYFVANDGIAGKELWAYGIYTTENCFAYFTTDYDTLQNTFFLNLDPLTSDAAISYFWDFGDGDTSTFPTPLHIYSSDTVYNICLKIISSSGDSCRYCHELGKDYLGNIIKINGFNLQVQNTTAITKIPTTDNFFSLYPNPNNGNFQLAVNNQQLTDDNNQLIIYNILGEVVYQSPISSHQSSFNVDISKKGSGVYCAQLLSEKSVITMRVVVER